MPGCTFTRRMYAKYGVVTKLDGAPKNALEFKLKQNHHVRLDREFKLDCSIWLTFLTGDLETVVTRQMSEFACESSKDIGFYSDAS